MTPRPPTPAAPHDELRRLGHAVPPALHALAQHDPDRCIAGLEPWFLLRDALELRSACCHAAGMDVLPFAQAIGEDLVACFVLSPSPPLAVVLVDPWGQLAPAGIERKFDDIEAWQHAARHG